MPRSVHDNTIFDNSMIRAKFKNEEYLYYFNTLLGNRVLS